MTLKFSTSSLSHREGDIRLYRQFQRYVGLRTTNAAEHSTVPVHTTYLTVSSAAGYPATEQHSKLWIGYFSEHTRVVVPTAVLVHVPAMSAGYRPRNAKKSISFLRPCRHGPGSLTKVFMMSPAHIGSARPASACSCPRFCRIDLYYKDQSSRS